MKALGRITASRRHRTISALAATVHAAHHSALIRISSGSSPYRKSGEPASSYCAFLETQIAAWERERDKASKLDIHALMAADRVSGSSFAPPWSVEIVKPEMLDALEAETMAYRNRLAHRQKVTGKRLPEGLPGNPAIFGIGPLKPATGANLLDSSPSALNAAIIDLLPGERKPPALLRGPYDVRACKYLFVIDQYGLHALHELTPCATTARGFGGHPQLPAVNGWAAIGGEAFFSDADDRKVFINFGSGRFPPESVAHIEATSRYWLACGMNEVVAVFENRDLSQRAYGLADRYGQQLPNKVYRRQRLIQGEGVQSPLP